MRKALATLIIVIALGGCSAADAVMGMMRSTDQFIIDANEPRVRYETGGEQLASTVSQQLSDSIKVVEERQYRPFAKPITVYVCATTDSCRGYCRSNVRGCVLNGRLFISPKPSLTPERVPGILKHELSHLHMEQQLGMLRWHSIAPPWFQEGLAVFISDGGGAENVTELEAIKAIAEGHTFLPDGEGSLLFRKNSGLEQHMFYRQSGLFIAFLHNKDPQAFKVLLSGIVEGNNVGTAVFGSYKTGLEELWSQFVAESKANNRFQGTSALTRRHD